MSSYSTELNTDLYGRFCQNLNKILPEGFHSMLIAYSGGADSALLLDCFVKFSQEHAISLHALHFNHKIRAEADDDAEFCKRICKNYQIPLKIIEQDVPAFAQTQKLGLEEAARLLRYEALEAYRAEQKLDYIATAHNATDNTETVLFHLARGSALEGICGISSKRNAIVRPFLPFSKEEILTYVISHQIPYREDATNADCAYTRNFIRHEILPKLETINPALHDAIYRFSQTAREDNEALIAAAKPYEDCTDTQVLASLPTAILRRVLLIKYRRIAHNEIRNEQLVKSCEKISLAARGHFSGAITFPGNWVLAINAKETSFYQNNITPIDTPITLSPDSDFIFQGSYRITVTENEPSDTPLISLTVPQDALDQITVRSRKDGDRYRQNNMTRRIKKMLCDSKIPAVCRDTLPLILYRNEIIFVLHLPISDHYQALSTQSEKTYRISIYKV